MIYFTKYAEEKFNIPGKHKDEQWEKVIDFTKIKIEGVKIDDILSKISDS